MWELLDAKQVLQEAAYIPLKDFLEADGTTAVFGSKIGQLLSIVLIYYL